MKISLTGLTAGATDVDDGFGGCVSKTLSSGEKLIGQGTTGTTFDSVFGITPPTGTVARPTLGSGTATLTGTLTLAGTTTLRGLALSTGTSNGLVGTGGLTGIDVAQTS